MKKLYVACIDNHGFENTLVGTFPSFEEAMKALAETSPEVTSLKWETNDMGTIYSACILDEYNEIIVSFDIYETELGKRVDYVVSDYFHMYI